MKDRSTSVRFHWYALVAYFLLTLLLTYPLILHFMTHVAGDGSDDPALAWNLWWVPYSILNLGTSPVYTDYMFFPIGLNLGFYTLTYLNAFLSIPFQFAFGVIPAANVNLILSFTLSGFGAYLLVTYLLRRVDLDGTTQDAEKTDFKNPRFPLSASQIAFAAFAAGLLYAFSANKFLYASLGQFNIASSQWIPFYILFLLKIFDTPRPPLKYGFLLGFFLLAQSLSEFIFASFLILFTIAYLLYWFLVNRKLVSNIGESSKIEILKSKILPLVVAVVVFVLPMLPILAAMISDTLAEGDFIQQGLGFSNIFSADLTGFFVPSHLHPLFGSLETLFHYPYMNFMYLGFTAIVLGILALWQVKPARMWGIWFAIFAFLTLGPTLRVNGAEFDLPMPFDVLLEIPFIKGNRYPSRWSVMLTLTLAILVGYGVAWILENAFKRSNVSRTQFFRSFQRYLLPAGICFLLLFEHLSIPLPLSNLRAPEIYSQIANEPGNWTVMEVPLAWRNGFRVTGSYRSGSQGPIDRIFMYAQFYQATQQHPILNGNTSRNPELKFQYFAETPVLNSLVAIQQGHAIDDATRAGDKELAPRVLQFFGTKYIIWHAPYNEANRAVANKTRAYIEETFPVTKINESYDGERGTVTYRVSDLPANETFILKPGDPLARLYLGEGWGAVGADTFVAQRREAKLFLPLSSPRDMEIRLDAFKAHSSHWNILVNGVEIAHLPSGSKTQLAEISKTLLRAGMNEITFSFDNPLPITASPNPPISLVIRSAGEEQGAFGHIYVNGVDESPNARGYNLVVMDPQSGEIIAREQFDTFASEQESERMAEFIAQIPDGKIVAVVASDEASFRLTQEGVDALQSLGAKTDLRNKFRWSHALLATKGSPQTAREAASETNVSQIISGLGLTEPNLAAVIGEIRIEPAQ